VPVKTQNMASSIADLFLRISTRLVDKLEDEFVGHFNEIGGHVSWELCASQKLSKQFFDELQKTTQKS